MKKFLLLLLSVLIIGRLVWLNVVNSNIFIDLTEPFTKMQIHINVFGMVWIAFVAGMIVCLCLINIKKNQKDLKAYKNQYEKISVKNEEQSDKVKILEEKVKSLEIALSKALER